MPKNDYLDDAGKQKHMGRLWLPSELLTELNRVPRVWHKNFKAQHSEEQDGAVMLVCLAAGCGKEVSANNPASSTKAHLQSCKHFEKRETHVSPAKVLSFSISLQLSLSPTMTLPLSSNTHLMSLVSSVGNPALMTTSKRSPWGPVGPVSSLSCSRSSQGSSRSSAAVSACG
jgi:hypothetical protein